MQKNNNMMNKATCKIVLDTKSKEVEKKLFLSVTYQRQAYQYSLGLGYKLTKEQFANKNLKITKEAFAEAEPEKLRAESIIKKLGTNFTFARFKSMFKGVDTESCDIMSDKIEDIYSHYLKDHPNLSQGTIDSYKTVINHLISFDKNIRITDISVPFLYLFQEYLKKKCSVTSEATINIYLRSIRAIYNYAEVKLELEHKNNPFGRNKIRIASNSNVKKAINNNDFQKILTYKPRNPKEEFAHDMFLISFGLVGMNIADILSITNKEINGEYLTFYRKKTLKRQGAATPITIKIGKPTMELIKKHGFINPYNMDDYVFPFLKHSMTEKEELRKRKDITKSINKSLKTICENLNIEKITTYNARHTIATMLMNSGTTVEAISKTLGHSNIKVTQNYLSQLSDAITNDISEKTTSFMTLETSPTDNEKDNEKIATLPPIIIDD